MKVVAAIMLITLTVFGPTSTRAEEPLYEQLKAMAHSESFRIGALVQVVGDYRPDREAGTNGFILANFRLSVGGKLDGGFGYFLQGSFTRSPGALDAAAWWSQSPLLAVKAGAFKAPLSSEFLTSAAGIDFVDRAQIVRALAPGRQIGTQVAGHSQNGLSYALGLFNGNGLALGNDDNNFMTVARVTATSHPRDDVTVTGGLNAMHSRDTDAPIGITLAGDFIGSGFAGERVIAGGDIRMTAGRWLGAAEMLWGQFDPRGGDRVYPVGFHVTGGVHLSPRVQVLARWDAFEGDGALRDADLAVLGLNFWPTSPTELQVNLIIPATGASDPGALVNFQVGF